MKNKIMVVLIAVFVIVVFIICGVTVYITLTKDNYTPDVDMSNATSFDATYIGQSDIRVSEDLVIHETSEDMQKRIQKESEDYEYNYNGVSFTDINDLSDSGEGFQYVVGVATYKVLNNLLTQYCNNTGRPIKTFEWDYEEVEIEDGLFTWHLYNEFVDLYCIATTHDGNSSGYIYRIDHR